MRDKKKLLALLLFLIMGFFMFTFANPSDGIGTLTKPVEQKDKDKNKDTNKDKNDTNQTPVVVVDNAPVITVEPKTVSIAFGTDYDVMTGVTVKDDKDNLVATPSLTDTKELEVGTYTITYTVTDSANNTVTETRTLIVFEDKNNNNLPDEDEEHYDVNFEVEGRGSLEGTTSYAEVLTGLTFEEAEIIVPEPVADKYYKFVEWTPVTPNEETVVEETVTYVAVFGPINDVNENGIADEEETYKLTVKYYYVNGTKAAKTVKEDVVYNTTYSVESPVIKYYKANKTVVEGTMPKNNVKVKVTYSPIHDINKNGVADEEETYTLTIEYKYLNGEVASDTVNKDIVYKMPYAIKSPSIKYYTASKKVVLGFMPNHGVKVVVVYTPNHDVNKNGIADELETYTLTINYNYSNGAKAADTKSDSVVYNMPYSVESPVIEYYTANKTVVEGTMPKDNVVENVVYTPNHDVNENGIADELETYTVTFVDYDGKVLAEVPVLINNDAELPENPTRAKKNGISYTFAGWDGDYTNVTENRTVKATYEISKIEATVYELKDEFEIPTVKPYYTGSTKDYTKLGTVELALTDEILNATKANKAQTVIGYEQENVLPVVVGELPTLTGYTYNWYVVKYESDGWHIDGKKTINEHTLTVTYRYSRDEEASETVSETKKYNEEYEVEVPVIEYYTPSINEIKGNMPDEDVTYNVIYTPNNDRNENGVADELDPHYNVTFVVRGPGKFASIDRVREFIARDTNEIEMEISKDEKTIIYSSILEGLTYAEWENSEDGQSYICATEGEINASVTGVWVDANGVRYNNLEKVYSDKTFYMDYFWDKNDNKIDDEKEAKYSVAFEITGKEGAAYFNEARINEAREAGATIATSTKIVYTGIVAGATINKYGYKTPIATMASGAKCSAWNPDVNATSTKVNSDITSTRNCFMDKNGNNIDDDKEERVTLTLEVVNGTFTDRAKTYFEGKGATVTDSTITFSNILPGTSYNSLYNDANYYNTVGLPGTTLTSRPTTPNVATAVAKITEDTTFIWVYSFNELTVRFFDENGNQIGENQTVEYGHDADAPAYVKESTAEFNFNVTWDKDFTNVTSNLDVNAIVTPVKRSYNVTFVDYDGTQIGEPQTIEYGNSAVAPQDPTRENYTFAGWDTEFTNITGETTVTATYTANIVGIVAEEKPDKYLVWQVNEDKDIHTIITVYTVDADGNRTEVADYTTNLDVTRATNESELVVTYVDENGNQYTDNSLTYMVIEDVAYDSKFEVTYTGMKTYKHTTGCDWNIIGTKGSNCDSEKNTNNIGMPVTFLEITEHYLKNIKITNVSVKYVGEENSIDLQKTGDIRYTNTTGYLWIGTTFYNPVYVAYLNDSDDIMTDERVIDTVTVTYEYNHDTSKKYAVTFKYNKNDNVFEATAEDPV